MSQNVIIKIKQLFCSHDYELIDYYKDKTLITPYTHIGVIKCTKCGKTKTEPLFKPNLDLLDLIK